MKDEVREWGMGLKQNMKWHKVGINVKIDKTTDTGRINELME